MTEAYKLGYKAGLNGKISSDNPYQKETQDYKDWLEGLIDSSL